MKTLLQKLIPVLLVSFSLSAVAATRYVDLNSLSPTPPYTSWPTAATNIQDAIDAAVDGDLVLVTNGIYATGGRIVYGVLTNRVVINKAIKVESSNGPEFTTIQGYQIPTGDTNYDRNIRCVYMTIGAVLSGFTITGGSTYALGTMIAQLSGGGVYCEGVGATLTNCVLSNNLCVGRFSAAGGGAVYQGTLYGCTIGNNSIPTNSVNYGVKGGGALQSVLNDCLVVSNSASFGGGTALSTLNNCRVSGNVAPFYGSTSFGGGLYHSSATNCLITENFSATYGGGAEGGPLVHCSLSNNACFSPTGVGGFGGGSYAGLLDNCLVVSNTASRGGGVYPEAASIVNCTIVGNTATNRGGGISAEITSGRIRNSVVYGNYCTSTSVSTSNTFLATPLNLTNSWVADPKYINPVAGDYRLQSNSPCINAGNNAFADLTDLNANPRVVAGTVDIGAYEFQSPASILSYAWLQQYGLPTDGSADYADTDGEGMNNYGEWRSDTIPTNALSVLRLVNATNSSAGAKVTWQSVSTRNYWLECATNLGVATNGGPYFYRVGVQ